MSIIKAEYQTCYQLQQQNFSYNTSGCSTHFDKSLCWSGADPGETARRLCPFTYCPTVPGCENIAGTHVAFRFSKFKTAPEGIQLRRVMLGYILDNSSLPERHMVSRACNANGNWADSDYTQCIAVVKEYSQCIQGYCRLCPDTLRDYVIYVSLSLSILSVALLVGAILLFSIYDSLQCRRLSIHKNLATAFVFRFAVLALWTIVQTNNIFQDCSTYHPVPLWNLEWICKTILWCVIYFQVASVMWMLIEGAYLYSRFTILAMRHNDAPWYMYMLCGWGVPFIVVICWTVVHEYKSRQSHSFCWVPYAQGNHLWILAGTMGFALIMNLLFLLGIVIILVQKLSTENSAESKKIWRTIKATLLLVPLLGVSNIPLFYEPDEPSAAYMLGSAILQHSQGIFIAVLYCFCNSEIQGALKRSFRKCPFECPFGFLNFLKPKHRFETERTYVPEGRIINSKHGVPMEELNKVQAEQSPLTNSTTGPVGNLNGISTVIVSAEM